MRLIINADDFGLSKSICDGIIYGIKKGIITSTTIMANMDYAEYGIKKAIENNIKCIGLHVNLTVGKPIIKNDKLTDEKGCFLYNRKQIENPNLTFEDAYDEIHAQVKMVDKYSNNKIKIDHIDMHHHLCDNKNIMKAIIKISQELNIPVRNHNIPEVKSTDLLNKDFTINNVNIEYFMDFIKKYENTEYTIELMTHCGFIDEETKMITSYLDRELELRILEKAKDMGTLKNIQLISYKEL